MRRLGSLVLLSLLAAGCAGGGGADGRVRVVAGFGPLAEMAERVGGPRVQVRDLTPAGAEPHDVELDSRDIDAIDDADVAVFIGRGFQPAVEQAAVRSERAVDLLEGVEGDDPHVWLDPALFAGAVAKIERALTEADPGGREGYRQRAAAWRAELEKLDAAFAAGLATCERRVIVTAHEAFGRLAARYRLEDEGITGISVEAEPNPRRLAELAELVERRGVTHVFTEELVSPKVAEALAREAGVSVATLDPVEARPPKGYVAAMTANLATLRSVLGCR